MENEGSTINFESENITTKTIAVIYNMVSKPNAKEEAEGIATSIEKCPASIIRARWNESTLLKELLQHEDAAKKAILVFNTDGLRQAGLNIRPGISWEQMVLETKQVVDEMTVEVKADGKKETKKVKVLELCKAVIVCMKHEGCMLFCGENVHLFYYCDEIEGDFIKNKNQPVFGSTSTMQATVAIGMKDYLQKAVQSPEQETRELISLVEIGLMLMRELIEHGYEYNKGEDDIVKVAYPYNHICKEYREARQYLPILHKEDKQETEESKKIKEKWKKRIPNYIKFKKGDLTDKNDITARFVDVRVGGKGIEETIELCKQIVVKGAAAAHIPYLKLEKLITFDREEVEHIRSIRRIVEQYKGDVNRKTPLSICVFGRPGSGKSFAVKQIVKSLKVKDEDIFEFNLSQMAGVRDLYAAFHQIRDAGLRGGLPVAFFDEFDAKTEGTELGWLKYFLAPMQDGEFRENGLTHFIGKALLVFAGGTCQSMEELRKKQTQPEMVQQKLPDFLSRIKGYIDVAGPNALPCPVRDKPNSCWMKAGLLMTMEEEPGLQIEDYEREYISHCYHKTKCCQDLSHYLRRAALLRSQLEQKLGKAENDGQYQIDERVLNAFLRVGQYKHGARSLNAIVETSHLEPGRPFTVTSIDSNFLDLYATDDFKRYLRQPPKPDKQSS